MTEGASTSTIPLQYELERVRARRVSYILRSSCYNSGRRELVSRSYELVSKTYRTCEYGFNSHM